nr:MAG: RNA-dependent RNA polymerase [Porcine picobirnavirus]
MGQTNTYADIATNLADYFQLPNPALRAMFGRISAGSSVEYRTKFYDGQSLDSILHRWLKHLVKIRPDWPTLWEFEIDLAKKVGPLSIMKPLEERMDDIDSYYQHLSPDAEPISDLAILQVTREWGSLRGLRLKSQDNTVEDMKKSTNSGSPFYTTKRLVVGRTVPCEVLYVPDLYGQYPGVIQELPEATWKAAAMLGWRGQEGGPNDDDVKQRVVWMFPFAVNVAELQLYQPLIAGAQKHKLVPAWIGMEAVDEEITKLFDTKGSRDLIVCTDFTKFDQHFGVRLQDAAQHILTALMCSCPDTKKWLEQVFPIKYNIPLVYRDGSVRVGRHGMGSGAGGTNADETIVHRALQWEAALTQGKALNVHSMCLGDDGILSYPGITIEDVTASYTRHGLDMNFSKQYASTDDCVYLRRWHHTNYRKEGIAVGVYSTCRALGRLAEQERFYDPNFWSKEMVALRQLSILENCRNHPLREEFVEFCMKGDKYRLGLDIPGFLDNVERIAKKATDEMPDFLGYTKSQQKGADTGINNWWIVKYLKSKQ